MKVSVSNMILRYLILIVVALPNLIIFYTIFTPLTVYPAYWLLGAFFDAVLTSKNVILLNGEVPIELIEACIAGSAYYLLFILNLSTPGLKTKKRIYMIFWSFVIFLFLNILRIFFLSVLAVSGSSFFDATHRFFWYAISTIFVVAIWFFEVKVFNVQEIPIYSDIKSLYEASKIRKKR